ncbi:DNA primase family protein [Oceanicella actignis]|uniref:Phage/plasmid primase, P4 family, C-terminal domain-containing protein n=1 Tax=Oceanicella actignis TaxID=1189325 RepID=A0A1M7U1X3_9RHOB|nr:phage/plasmid primase, P4 family [Oceanicella actignis]SES76309.1 virus D5 protein-like [Oceanicella actignis]SHN77005.1 phage/plasmid primase, P4 family, C-terminal domain-containing protein [Oceanicella actignis]
MDGYRDLMSGGDPDRKPRRAGADAPRPAPPPADGAEPPPDVAAALDRARLRESDMGNAERLRRVYGAEILFTVGKGWAVRDGARYSFRGGEVAAVEIGQRLAALVEEEAAATAEWLPVSDFEAEQHLAAEVAKKSPRFADLESARVFRRRDAKAKLLKHAEKCENAPRIKAALEMLRTRVRVDIEDLDRDVGGFVCPNGRVDLEAAAADDIPPDADAALDVRQSWLGPVDWESRPTKCAGVEYDPAADAPKWRAFLELIQPDAEVRDFLQRCLGMLLFGRNDSQVCLLMRGGGGNGKSTMMDAISYVLGERDGYAAPCKVDMFLVQQGRNTGAATPEEVDLPGARAYIASEPAATDTFSAKAIKAFTGGDPRPARGLGMPQFIYRPSGVPVISFNRTPRIKDEDEGTRRRLVFIPFDVLLHKLPEEQRRSPTEVAAELRAEGPGILNWLVDGWRAYRRHGLRPPKRVIDLKDDLMADADPVGNFLRDCTDADAESRIGVTELHRVYEEWCAETGANPWSAKAFGAQLVEKGLRKRKKSSWFWLGIGWKRDDFTAQLRGKCGFGAGASSRPAADHVSDAEAAAFMGDPPF